MTSLFLMCAMAQAAPLDTLIGAEEVVDAQLFGPPTSDVSLENQVEPLNTPAEAKQALLTWDDLAASEPASTTTKTTSPVASLNPMVMMPLGLGLLAGAWFLRKNLMGQVSGVTNNDPMTIISRKSLGNQGSIVVVDVMDLDGIPRRLVVGAGQGSPTLVADISAPSMLFSEPDMTEEAPSDTYEFSPEPDPMPQQVPTMASNPSTTDIQPIQRRAAQDLVDELLAERQGYGRTLRGSRVNVTA